MQLPQRTKSHNAWHYEGFYFLMRFYAGPFILKDIDRHLKVDPRMVRFNVVKLGEKYVVQKTLLTFLG
jgi:ribosomal protein S6